MVFKGLRRARNREHFMWHLQRMATLEQDRDAWEGEGRCERVLSTNYELVSHASRALVALRKLEELGESLRSEGVEKYRAYLLAVASLPSIPEREIRLTPPEEVARVYRAYREYVDHHPSATGDGL